MIVTVKDGFDPAEVKRELVARGLWVERLEGAAQVHFAVAPYSRAIGREALLAIGGVAAVAALPSAHPRVDAQPARIRIGTVDIGAGAPKVVMAGPCSVESPTQIRELAAALAPLGVKFLRGGAYKPRTSPYSFQGLGAQALGWLRRAADEFGLQVVTEAMGADELPLVAATADLVQVGSRNMQNYALLRSVAATGRPVLLKRGMAATLEEWILAGEYCLHHGAEAVVFCERGVRGFDPSTRNLLDLGAVALLAHVQHAPVIVDPSHGAGRRDLIAPLARAALAAGAAGLLVETHLDPGRALSDGAQSLLPEELRALIGSLDPIRPHDHGVAHAR